MITFDFAYYRPPTLEKAIQIYQEVKSQGERALFYGGGTEIIYRAKRDEIGFDALIDLKKIPQCIQLEADGDRIIIGAAVSLTKVINSNLYPLLSAVCRGIGDHTARNQITLGGNVLGQIPYREALLPLLLAKTELVIASEQGVKTVLLKDVYNKKIELPEGELLTQILVDAHSTTLPHFNLRKTRQSQTGYPIISVAAVDEQGLKVAISGLCAYPFRFAKGDLSRVLELVPDPILDDQLGVAAYREFVAKNALQELVDNFRGAL